MLHLQLNRSADTAPPPFFYIEIIKPLTVVHVMCRAVLCCAVLCCVRCCAVLWPYAQQSPEEQPYTPSSEARWRILYCIE